LLRHEKPMHGQRFVQPFGPDCARRSDSGASVRGAARPAPVSPLHNLLQGISRIQHQLQALLRDQFSYPLAQPSHHLGHRQHHRATGPAFVARQPARISRDWYLETSAK
jgi:hypothetical protein